MYIILEPSNDCDRTYYLQEFNTLEEAMNSFVSGYHPTPCLFYKGIKQVLTLKDEEN